MNKTNYTWQQKDQVSISEEFQAILATKKINPLIGQMLVQRGIASEAQLTRFLEPAIENLYDPYLMYDMDRAISRIQQAVIEGQKILIYGDYDADGITSTTLLKETLEMLGGDVTYVLPNRFIHGYGPNVALFKEKIATGIQLIVTCDNGVSGHEAIEYANSQGVDVVVTDHHELPETLPKAYAIVHPRHPKGQYPFGELAGVGVAFKVATALLEEVPAEFFDLVAIGTVADLVSLTDENRTLVQLGLKSLEQSARPGLQALLNLAANEASTVTESTIGFALAPRLNAIGRLQDPNPAVELLTTFDEEVASELATKLDEINTERKQLVESTTKEALLLLDPTNEIHIIAKANWHEGILGIVAGNIVKETGRPAIVLTIKEDGIAKGSGRSIDTFNLFDMLNTLKPLFERFGGHHSAVGLSLVKENVSLLQTKANAYVTDQQLDLSKGNQLTIDEALTIGDVSTDLIQSLRLLAPFGMDNPLPTFVFKNVTVASNRAIGADQKHLKFTLSSGDGQLEGIGFNFGPQIELFKDQLDIVGTLEINEWNGVRKPQLLLCDFKSDEAVQLVDRRAKRTWNQPLAAGTTLYLAFHKKGAQVPFIGESNVVVYDKATTDFTNVTQLVVVDCPENIAELKEICQAHLFERIYLYCYTREEAYLAGMGTHEQYARLYKFVAQQATLDVRYKLKSIANYLKIPENLLVFMIRVFFELKFVTIDDGVLKKVENAEKRAFSESTLYQMRQQQIKTEEFLLLSDLDTIKQWLSK